MILRVTWRRAVAALGTLLVAAFAFWWVAPYDISARVPHWRIFGEALHGYMNNAVRLRTLGVRPPPQVDLDDPALLRLGASHFLTGCATCHGAPGVERNPIVQMMNPEAPYLPDVQPRRPAALHWITYNGIKYTGMPGWTGEGREDEAWAVAAFLAKLPEMTVETFRELAFDARTPAPVAAIPFGQHSGVLTTFGGCVRCHGSDGLGRDGTAPQLAGQTAAYLRRALDNYAGNHRQSGIMEPMAAPLTDSQRDKLAAYFAALPFAPPADPPRPAALAQGDAAQGERLARRGDPARNIGACLGCHGQPGNPAPRIAGQYPRFLADWLRLWRTGPQAPGPHAERMAAAVRMLSDQDIADLTTYFAGSDSTAATVARVP